MNIEKVRKKSEKMIKQDRKKKFKALVRKFEEEINSCLYKRIAYPSVYEEEHHTIEAVCGYFISKGFSVRYNRITYYLSIKW